MPFDGRVLVIGCGSVSQCTLPLLLRHLPIPAKSYTVLDFADNRYRIEEELDAGVNWVFGRVESTNLGDVLSRYVSDGDLVIDLAWNIDCVSVLDWCHRNGVRYLNTSVEVWDPYAGAADQDPRTRTLYNRQMAIRALVASWSTPKGPTAVLDHGANPGLVSHFTKEALTHIADRLIREPGQDPRFRELLTAAEAASNFAGLAQLMGVKVIHISERDTQITSRPKQVDEFVNTWSVEGLYEEGIAPAELGWGTHERQLPAGAFVHESGPRNQICLAQMGMKTWVRSWVPHSEITGMVIRHGEAFSISDHLTVWKDGNVIYRPTVHYAYCPSDAAINSVHELEMRNLVLQPAQRILVDEEIVSGRDAMGVLVMGHPYQSWWTGSLLSIEETRALIRGQNATTLQVAASVLAAVSWMLENPRAGVNQPDDLPWEDVLEVAKPYLGSYFSEAVEWNPLKNRNPLFDRFNPPLLVHDDPWQFANFLV